MLNAVLAKTLDGARAALAAWRSERDALAKRGRGRTDVARFLSRAAPRLEGRIATLLRRRGRAIARKASELLPAQKLAKADADVQRILDQLEADGVAAAVVDELTPEIERAFREAEASALASLEIESDGEMVRHADEAAIRYARERAAELVTQIEETTRDGLRDQVERAVAEGWSPSQLADAVQDDVIFSEYRAEMISRTELAYAHVGGNVEGYRESGVVERKRWVVGAGCCDDCADLDGVEVDLDDDFEYADGPIDAPPAHPNCRCDVEPVVVERS